MKVALVGHDTEVVEGTWAFLYGSKKEAKEALAKIELTYSESGISDYEIVPQSEVEITKENYNSALGAYKQ